MTKKNFFVFTARDDENKDDVETASTPLLSSSSSFFFSRNDGDDGDDDQNNKKYVKRRGGYFSPQRVVLLLFFAATTTLVLIGAVGSWTRGDGVVARFSLLGGSNANSSDSARPRSAAAVLPDEDELTKGEIEKIDFFLEERRKELVKEAVAKHAREQAKKDAAAAAAAAAENKSDKSNSGSNNHSRDNNNNKKSSATDGTENGGGGNKAESKSSDKKNGVISSNNSNNNNNNNNNNGGKKVANDSGNAKNTAALTAGASSAKVGVDESKIASTSTTNSTNNNNTNTKNSDGGAFSPTTNPGNVKPKQQQQQQKQQQQKQQQQQQVQKNATNSDHINNNNNTTTNTNTNTTTTNNNNNSNKKGGEVVPDAKEVVGAAAVIAKDVAKGIAVTIADVIDDEDDGGFFYASDEKYKPDPVSQVRFLNDPSNNAKCLDGSPPAYYLSKRLDRGVRRKRCTTDGVLHSCGETWIIMLSGGGTCVNDEDCTRRAATGLGTSKLVPRTYHFSSGIQSVLKNNEAFNTANMVNIAYCSGDSWLGRSSEPDAYGLTMNGGLIVDAILDELINHHDLLSARNIIFSGKSAGGVGLVAQIDRWADTIAEAYEAQGYDPKFQPPKVSAVAFAGFHYFHTHTFYDPRDQVSIGENKNSDDDSKDVDKEEASKDKHGGKSDNEKEEEFEPVKFDEMVEEIFEQNAKEDLETNSSSSKPITVEDVLTEPAAKLSSSEKKRSISAEKYAGDGDKLTTRVTATSISSKIKQKEGESGIFDEILSTFKGKLHNRFQHSAELGESDDDEEQKNEDGVYLNSAESRLLLRFGLNTSNSTNIYGQMKPSFIPWDETSWKKYLKFWRAEASLPSECVKQRHSSGKDYRCAVARNSIKTTKTPVFFVQALTDSVVMSIHDNWPLADHRFVQEPDLKSMTLASSKKHASAVQEKRKQTQKLVEKTIDDLNSGVLDMKVYEDKQLELTKKMWENLDEDERSRREEYAKMWKTQMIDRLREATNENPNVGVFAPSCYVHTKFDKIEIDGADARSALASWVYDGQRTIIIDDKCDENGGGLFCNPSCQDTAPQLEKAKGSVAPERAVDENAARIGGDEGAQQQKQQKAANFKQ
jgi:hypothetical protein